MYLSGDEFSTNAPLSVEVSSTTQEAPTLDFIGKPQEYEMDCGDIAPSFTVPELGDLF